MLVAALREAVVADELAANSEAGGARGRGAEHGLHRGFPQTARGELAAVVADIVVRRAGDAEPAERVAERERDRPLDRTMLRELLRLDERDVARRRVDVKHRRQDELHRAALGARDEIDAARVAAHALLELVARQQEQRDRSDAEREQHDVERGIERPRLEVRQAETGKVHDAPPEESSSRVANRLFARWSCVAITSVAPHADACDSRRSSVAAQ